MIHPGLILQDIARLTVRDIHRYRLSQPSYSQVNIANAPLDWYQAWCHLFLGGGSKTNCLVPGLAVAPLGSATKGKNNQAENPTRPLKFTEKRTISQMGGTYRLNGWNCQGCFHEHWSDSWRLLWEPCTRSAVAVRRDVENFQTAKQLNVRQTAVLEFRCFLGTRWCSLGPTGNPINLESFFCDKAKLNLKTPTGFVFHD